MSKVVVFGATGFAGGKICAELEKRGHHVTGVSRSGAGGAVQADATEALAVRPIIKDADVVVISIRAFEHGVNLLAQAVKAVLDSGVDVRLGVVGGSGSLSNEDGGPRRIDLPGFPEIYMGEATAHAETLEYLQTQDSSIDWFYVSPTGSFNHGPEPESRGSYRTQQDVLVVDADGQSHMSGDDYALAFVDEIENPRHHRQRFSVGH